MRKTVRRANRLRNLTISLATAVALAQVGTASAAPLDDQRHFSIPPQPLSSALLTFAKQASVQVMMASDALASLETTGISGTQSPIQALSALLRGTGLRFRIVSDNAVAIEVADGKSAIASEPIAYQSDGESFRLAQAEVSGRTEAVTHPAAEETVQALDEVVVTGTYLRNSRPITPVVTLTRDDLAKRGYTSLPQLMEQLPQNFTAGVSPGSNPTSGKGTGATSNQTFASGINLRGLGPSATLVLLNGRRLAPAAYAGVADISQIPINIIEKVEILTDGASGLYGSDAVAGVVNIVTVQDFSGFEIQARGTGISEGKSPNYGSGAIAGASWDGGGGVLSIDYQKDEPLLARDRSFTGQLPDSWSLTPENEIANIFGSGHHQLADAVKLSAEGFFTKRKFGASYVPAQLAPGSTPWRYDGETRQYNGSLQLDWNIASDWHAVLVGQASKEDDDVDNSQPFPAVIRFPASYRVLSVEPRVDGTLFDAPGGAVRVALGAQLRSEKFSWSQFFSPNVSAGVAETLRSKADNDRRVRSVYMELSVPLIGAENANALAQSLRLDVSGRYDRYSDFGDTTNPKVGIEWVPFRDVTVHGTYSQSFKAPTLFQLSSATNYAFVLPVTDPRSETGSSLVLLKDFLSNPNLQPETAESYNFGVTYQPENLPGLYLDASYFSVDFEDRIVVLISEYFTNVLEQEAALGSFLRRNPSADEVNAILGAGPTLINWAAGNFTSGPFTPADIRAIADVGSNNAAVTEVRGIDLSARYRSDEASWGRLLLNTDASYFMRYDQRLTPGQSPRSITNTLYQPLRFRASVNLGWEKSEWGANVRINYANAYHNTIDANCAVTNSCDVASWTTVDLNLSYATAPGPNLWDGVRVGLMAANLFNRAPPRVITRDNNLGYDAVNANPLLRSVGVVVSKRFGGQ